MADPVDFQMGGGRLDCRIDVVEIRDQLTLMGGNSAISI